MLSKRSIEEPLGSAFCEPATDDDELSWPSISKEAARGSGGIEDSATESESLIEIEEEEEDVSPILPMAPPPRLHMKKRRRGPYKTRPKPQCAWECCQLLSTSAKSKFCAGHKEKRRRIRNKFMGASACTFLRNGEACNNGCFRENLCHRHYILSGRLKKER